MTTEERLEKLEKELMRGRRFNLWLLAGLGLVIGAWIVGWAFRPGTAMGQPAEAVAREVRARRFVLEDANGKERALLVVFDDGPRLHFLDENGKFRATLRVDKDGSGLDMLDEKGNPRAALDAIKDGASLFLSDENGKGRRGGALLAVGKVGPGPGLCLLDEKGNPRATLDMSKVGASLHLSDENGKGDAFLNAGKDGPGLVLADEKGKTIWKAP
jgi:hypothetical protein